MILRADNTNLATDAALEWGRKPNNNTAPNAAMTLRFQIEHDERGIGESRR